MAAHTPTPHPCWRVFVSETNGTERINYRHDGGDGPALAGGGGSRRLFFFLLFVLPRFEGGDMSPHVPINRRERALLPDAPHGHSRRHRRRRRRKSREEGAPCGPLLRFRRETTCETGSV